jgi:hypothetical protein
VGYVAAEDLEIWVFETYFVEIDAVEIDLHLQDDDRRLVKRSYIDVLRCEQYAFLTGRTKTIVEFGTKSSKI